MRLKDWLEQKDLSSKDLGKELNVAPQTIMNAIHGKNITVSVLLKIIAFTNGEVGFSDLMPKDLPKSVKQKILEIEETGKDNS